MESSKTMKSMEAQEAQEDAEDERREESIASLTYLNPDCIPKGIREDQITKLQELHARRLKLKSKSHKKPKGRHTEATSSSKVIADVETQVKDSSSTSQPNTQRKTAPAKRQKLYWGLDTKQRWERKANM